MPPSTSARRVSCLPLLALACAVAGCTRDARTETGEPGGMLAELARASELPRTLAPRLSIPAAYRPCSLDTPPEGTIPRTTCHAPSDPVLPSRDILNLAARASAAVHARVDPEALHTAALIDLVWGGGAGASLERSISYLQTASRLSERPAPVLADLAAAYLVRAEANQTPRDLLEAIEVAEQALQHEARNVAARFNLALALDRLGLEGQMIQAWRQFLAGDSTSQWADEARIHLRAAASVSPPPALPANASAAELVVYAARAPQEARLLGWDHLLGEWGAAVLRADSMTATERLRLAGAIGNTLQRREGDATLADAVRAIGALAGERAALQSHARAHHAYSQGRLAFLRLDYAVAERRFAAVLATRPRSKLLDAWARNFQAATFIAGGRRAAAEGVYRSLLAGVDTVRHPALAGAAWWGLSTVLIRDGKYEQALGTSETAARLFERIGEREHLGGVRYLAVDAALQLGAMPRAHESTHKALATLRPYGGSVWLSNTLAAAARAATTDGFQRAVIRLQNERVAVAERTGQPIYVAEARLARAQALSAAGHSVQADEDISASESIIQQLEPGGARSWLEADLRLAQGTSLLRSDPERAIPLLDSVVAVSGGTRTAPRLMRSLIARADARLAFGDTRGATSDLDSATTLLDAQHATTSSAPLRASLLDAAQRVFDQLLMLQVANLPPAAALAYAEKSRAALTTTGRQAAMPMDGQWKIPHGNVAIEYALVGDTLLIWTVTDGSVRLTRRTLDRTALLQSVERVRASLELRADDAATHIDLATLYDRLIRPIETQLGPEGTQLVLVADGELAGIPFAGLFDGARQRYLVEAYMPRFVSSLRDATEITPKDRRDPMRALVVADPAFDSGRYASFGRLKGAENEARAIAAVYGQGTLLKGRDANRPALKAALRHADLLHFAGHAVFDDRRPEQSFLLLAPTHRTDNSGRLTAEELQNMDLGHLQLVVLSACETLRAGEGRSGGFAGFADALLAAGVTGVIGSNWRVDDSLTDPLMTEFHRAYHSSGNGPAALRSAQLRLLHAADPALRSPATWAGFQYAGN